MKLKHGLPFALAVAVAIALSPLAQLRAAPTFGSSQDMSNDLAQTVQMKKAKKKAKKGKKAKGKKQAAATKSCGTFKYRKGGKCVDARDKK